MSDSRVGYTGSLVLVGVGAVVGTMLRYALGLAWPDAAAVTLVVNLVGAFLLGALVTVIGRAATELSSRARGLSESQGERLRLLLGTGLLGGFTTYSGLAVVIGQAALGSQLLWALGYAAVTLLIGLVASLLGMWVGGLGRTGAEAAS